MKTIISETCYNAKLTMYLRKFQQFNQFPSTEMFLLDTVMSWDFFVPVSVGDLVKTGGINQYVVQDVVPPKHVQSSLNSKCEI